MRRMVSVRLYGWMAATAVLVLSNTAVRAETIHWPMNGPSEITQAVNIEPGRVAEGRLSGHVAWDPHVSFHLPAEGIDAGKFTWLCVRMYSSAEADVLDVYYESPDGRWCLGGKSPIAKGWATYRMNLSQNAWRETRTGEDSRQWGGPSKRVKSLRIDPGNQADRWVMIDDVALQTAEAGFQEGVRVEPRGTAEITAFELPASVETGQRAAVAVEMKTKIPQGLSAGTSFVQLRRGATILRLVEKPVALGGELLRIGAELPISAYWNPGPATVEVGCYELDLPTGGFAAGRELAITSRRIGSVRPPAVELRRLGGDAAVFVDGQVVPAFAFLAAGGLHLDRHREAAQAGIHLYCDWFGTSRYSDMGHVAPDRYEYSEFDRYFAAILDVDPDAYFLPHVGVTGPLWWQQRHPEEMCQFEDGSKGPTSFASQRWRQEMGDDLRKLIAYLRQAPYADRILGYIFYNGYTAEWQMWGTWQESRDDYSEPAVRAFRKFLADRYGTDQRLREAWADPAVTLAAAAMPDAARRRPGGPRVLRDPKSERQAVDFYEFISNMDADAILHFARITREATEGRALVGTYYAYLTAHGINQQDSGHLAARRVFDSPDIDLLLSPPNYAYRGPGETSTFMSATDSFRLRGKLWFDESDHRTHLTDPGAGYGRADTLEETLGVFWREFAEVLTKRAAVSWFDMSGGWLSHPKLLADMGRAREIMRASLPERKPFAAEIGVFVDPRSFYWMRPTMANAALDLNQVVTMPQSGAPWDFCLLEDIGESWMPNYKFYVFLNAFYIDKAQREAIHARLRRNGATALFVYAPGYLGPEGESLEAMRALTGIRVAREDGEGRPQVLLNASDPLARGLAADRPMGAEQLTVAPVFYADDPEARVVGHLKTGQPALVVKKMDGWTSVYSAAIQLPPGLIRNLARSAGVHTWMESDDALYTDGRFVGVHAAGDGEKIVRLPRRAKVVDTIGGEAVGTDGQTVRLPMKRAETILLRLEPVAR
ncbi:MAG: beta-galactosidase [Pirellulales bacterium]|nr:beta-galactosidase [Pirellulales bacterium]